MSNGWLNNGNIFIIRWAIPLKRSRIGSFHNVGVGEEHSVGWLLCQLYKYNPNDILLSSLYMVSDVWRQGWISPAYIFTSVRLSQLSDSSVISFCPPGVPWDDNSRADYESQRFRAQTEREQFERSGIQTPGH